MKNTTHDVVALIGRLLMSFIFIAAGYEKIGGYAGTAAFMQAHGVPGQLLPLVIALEIGGGLALALGFYGRIAALLLALFSLAAIALFLLPPVGEQGHIIVMAELAMAGGLFGFVANGPGALSLDGLRGRR